MHAPSRHSLVFLHKEGLGWGPIEHLVQLISSLLEIEIKRPVAPAASRPTKLWRALSPVRRGAAPGEIYVVRAPGEIQSVVTLNDFSRRRQFRALWIVDSFWTEHAPSSRLMRHFDLIIYMQKGEAAFYDRLAPGRTLFLGWGADALDLGSSSPERPVDVLRVGRQPNAWDDDRRSAVACEANGLRFSGRPPPTPETSDDPSANHRALCAHYAQAKFVVAHSNLAAPARYTHPTKEYITGRWTDALAAGAVVAGVQPFKDASARELLWTGAALHFDEVDLKGNIATLRSAVDNWTPEIARRNRREALIRLDWRWRLKTLSERLNLTSPALQRDLDRLKSKISDLS